jgi:hypothetical protein
MLQLNLMATAIAGFGLIRFVQSTNKMAHRLNGAPMSRRGSPSRNEEGTEASASLEDLNEDSPDCPFG